MPFYKYFNPTSDKSLINESNQHRPDLDGLRGFAIFLVLIFHFFPNSLKGGFVGVDIFFVLSGFLITSNILVSLNNGNFSFIDFYCRRVLRIFPALSLILLFCIVSGWFFLYDNEYSDLCRYVLGGAFFSTNFISMDEVGYFNSARSSKPLIHLWSLAIEEQFYLIWPIIAFWLHKNKKYFYNILLLLLIMSFEYSVYLTRMNTELSYLHSLSRFWELLLGALLAVFMKDTDNKKIKLTSKFKNALSPLGLVLIGASCIKLDSHSSFPGVLALFPCFGTMFIILGGSNSFFNRVFFSNKVLVMLGLISYPLYLWHWTLLSFAYIVLNKMLSLEVLLLIVLLSVLLSMFTYLFIEKPIRTSRFKFTLSIVLITLVIGLGMLGSEISKSFWLKKRSFNANNIQNTHYLQVDDKSLVVNGCNIWDQSIESRYGFCKKDLRQAPVYGLIGDSKAMALFNGLVKSSKENQRWLAMAGTDKYNAVVPILSTNANYSSFQELLSITLQALSFNKEVKVVTIAISIRKMFILESSKFLEDLKDNKNYNLVYEGLKASILQLLKADKGIVIVVDNPTLSDPSECLERKTKIKFIDTYILKNKNPRCELTLKRHLEITSDYRSLLSNLTKINPAKVKIFDATSIYCGQDINGKCTTVVNGNIFYSFTDHLSEYGSNVIGKELNDFIEKSFK